MLKHPDDLQDRDILTNMDAHRGAGVQFEDFVCKRNGDLPIAFIARVKGEYRAWYDRKEAENRRKAAATQRSASAEHQQSLPTIPVGGGLIQGAEASLEVTLKAQVDALSQRVARKETAYREAVKQVEAAKREWFDSYADLRQAERLVAALEKQDGREYPPDVDTPMGGDLPTEVGQRRKKRRSRVGESSNTEALSSGGTQTNESDPSIGSGLQDLK